VIAEFLRRAAPAGLAALALLAGGCGGRRRQRRLDRLRAQLQRAGQRAHRRRRAQGHRASGRRGPGPRGRGDDRRGRPGGQRARRLPHERRPAQVRHPERAGRLGRARRDTRHPPVGGRRDRQGHHGCVPLVVRQRLFDAHGEPDRAAILPAGRGLGALGAAVRRAVLPALLLGRGPQRDARHRGTQALAARALGRSGRLAALQERHRGRRHRGHGRRDLRAGPHHHRHRPGHRRADRRRRYLRFRRARRHPRRTHHGGRQDLPLRRFRIDRFQPGAGSGVRLAARIARPRRRLQRRLGRRRRGLRHAGLRLPRGRRRLRLAGCLHAGRLGQRGALSATGRRRKRRAVPGRSLANPGGGHPDREPRPGADPPPPRPARGGLGFRRRSQRRPARPGPHGRRPGVRHRRRRAEGARARCSFRCPTRPA
jgi:hypothetical protein